MHLVVVMMLGICVPSIATGLAEVYDAAEPADLASKGASPPPPPPPAKATGELTDGERLFQGVWQLNDHGSDKRTGTLRIDGRDFRADGVNGRYVGYVSIRADTSPPQVDFTIDDCECKYKGMTSTGIYYEDDGTIVFAAPAPGEPRPKAFTSQDEMVRLRPLDPATEGDNEKPR